MTSMSPRPFHPTPTRPAPAALWILLFSLLAPSYDAHSVESTAWNQHVCRYCRQLEWVQAAAADSSLSNTKQYAPSREIDILHLAIDVTPDFSSRSLRATTSLRFKPIAKSLSEIRLDAVELHIQSVTSSRPVEGWQSIQNSLRIQFKEALAPDSEATVTITYQATPVKGLYFRTPEMGYPSTDTHLWTQGEAEEARHWFPCFDSPNEKFTSEVTCRVPEGMTVVANGRKVSSEKDPASGLIAVRWLQDKPHTAYLIALIAGQFQTITDQYQKIPLAFHTTPSLARYASSTFNSTKATLAFLEDEIGIPYPWDKYDQACVADFVAGGMENTSLTILTDNTLYGDGFETLRSSESLVAHELAHQWFGDLVTCKDWGHLWLNEGFATYYDALYHEKQHGRDLFLYHMFHNARAVVNASNDRTPIVHRDFNDPMEQFSFRAYPKGAWVLHMLRSQLGVDLYRKCVKTYLERHQYGTVETEDLVRVIEELSGRSFDRFFDQYVFHPQQPTLNINYDWDGQRKLAKLTLQQTQKLAEGALLFQMPALIRFKGSFGTLDFPITFSKQTEDFYFPLPEAPKIVRFDPQSELLAKVEFSPPTAMLLAQLEDSSDMIGRLLAATQLRRADPTILAALKKCLNEDSFFGVRIAASESLRAIGTEAALDIIRSSLDQPDARVRAQVVRDAISPYSEKSMSLVQTLLAKEKNPDIRATLIRALAPYPSPQTQSTLIKEAPQDSFRGHLTSTALEAIRLQEDPAALPELLKLAATNHPQWPTRVSAVLLETIGHLGRHLEKKEEIRKLLLTQLSDPRQGIKIAAAKALGSLGDPAAAGALDTFSSLPERDRLRKTAEQAATDLRAQKKPSQELGDIRSELLKLQKENKDLRSEMETLKKKWDSAAKPASASGSSTSKLRPGTERRPGTR